MVNKRVAFRPEARHQLHCEVPIEIRDRLWAAARAADMSPSQWVRRAIRDQLEREDNHGHE